MKILRFYVFIILFVFCVTLYGLNGSIPHYWIAFSGYDLPTGHGGGVPKFLMEIDATGAVEISPKQVLNRVLPHLGHLDYGVAISTNGKGAINMWLPQVTANGNRRLFRAIINKKSLSVISTHQTPLMVTNSYFVAVTDRRLKNFLTLQSSKQGDEIYIANPLSPNGAVLNQQRILRDQPATCMASMNQDCGLSISGDGNVLLFQGYKQPVSLAIIQEVTSSDRPMQSVVASGRTVQPLDVSNIIAQSVRYVLYSRQIHPFEYILLLQKVERVTLRGIGNPIKISAISPVPQAAVIESHGRFVIYKDPVLGLSFQALDATGHPSGNPKSLTMKFGAGLDILPDQDE